MKCEKSYKRDMLKRWGIRQLGLGRSFDEVTADMRKYMNKTVAEVKLMVRT